MQKRTPLLLPLLILVTACGDGATADSLPGNAAAAVTTYAALVRATYDDTVAATEELQDAVDALLAAPTEATLAAARQAWRDAREPYLQSEVFRFYDGPIDGPPDYLEGRINAWPMDENYVDYVESDAAAGIINDDAREISADALASLNAVGGDANVSTGYHAVEFLLWGQDRSATGPGDRPHTDFLDGGTAQHQARRRQYLQVVTDLLVADLTAVRDRWAPDAANYRADFEAASPAEGLRRVLTGMITLSGFETGGERLQAALDSGSQEDEHSCFSDNTHRDMIQDIQGVQNVWRGAYTRRDASVVSGVGVREVVAAADPDLAAAVDAKIDASLALANALVAPFDQEIALSNTAGRQRVQALIVSLHEQEGLLQDVFRLLALQIPVGE
ncbi:MAG: iron-regulated protein [Deltaproteobacteria bacterium HGW-Deltaproteobacteria-14]|jgi:putative iron-regulated protein|nr:MAG: iron-regulated protein [Deltaproteobacteria bacterium HGW-Deltaproteobacteria-14]